MTRDHHKVSPVVTRIAAAVPDVFSLLEHINSSPGTWYAAKRRQMPLLPYLSSKSAEDCLLLADKASSIVLLQVYMNSSDLYHNLVRRHLDHLYLPSPLH